MGGHNTIINSLAINSDNVFVSGGDDGTMRFWDWRTGYCFQELQPPVQPGSLDSESGVFMMRFDRSESRFRMKQVTERLSKSALKGTTRRDAQWVE